VATLQLTTEEQDLVGELLDRAYRDLKEEIYKTEAREFKEALHARERILQGLIQKISAMDSGATNAA
jgi:hypothetical protein